MTSILSILNNLHSLEIVDRVGQTQLQVGESSNLIIWRLNSKSLWNERMPVIFLSSVCEHVYLNITMRIHMNLFHELACGQDCPDR